MIWLQRYLVLILISISLLFFSLATVYEFNTELAVVSGSIITLAAAWFLERFIPYRTDWQISNGDVSDDVTSAFVIVGVADPLLKVAAPVAITWFYSVFYTPVFLSELALWHQIVIVLLLVEFGKYWSHRLHHQFYPTWWLHAMHHSSERLYFLNGLRFHPLNYVINFTTAVMPVMLLGVSPEAILGYLAITQPVTLLQHANINLKHGWLNRVFSTPEAHRWHHSTIADEANRNYGNAILLWDHVFGTFKNATGFNHSIRVGLFASSTQLYPAKGSYFTQLLSMFKPGCCRVAD